MSRSEIRRPNELRGVVGGAGRRTLEELARAILPSGANRAPAADPAAIARAIVRRVGDLPPHVQLGLRALLAAWELAPLATRHRRRFSRLDAGRRATYLEQADAGGWRRSLLIPLKALCLAAYTESPGVAESLDLDHRCLDPSPPRAGPRLHPIAHPDIAGRVSVNADAVVVGSGAGGAVVARELAERGLSVVVVEEGAYFTREDFQGPLSERMGRLYRSGGLTAALGRPVVPIPLGKAVGGTTVVNSGTCFRTPDAVLREWESGWGIEGVSPEAMAPVFERVEQTLGVQPVPEALLGGNARVFQRGLEALGLPGAPIRRNIEGCRGCGVCAFGCPSDAKQAMHLSYLPRAEAAGAHIYARCRVRRILRERGRAAGVEAEILDGPAHGRREAMRGRLVVRARRVVLAAGAIHTPLLLFASDLAHRGGPVGRGLRIHPAVGVTAAFDEDVHGWRGTLQSFFTDAFRESQGLVFEATAALPGVSAASLPGVGANLEARLAEHRELGSVGLFVTDTGAGRVRRLPGGAALVTYRLAEEDARRLVRGIALAARIFLAAGARRVYPGLAGLPALRQASELRSLEDRAWPASSLTVVGFHPVGTAAMGRDPRRCAVDGWGESHVLPGLYVADASALPGCAGVNPQVTIMAMATRIAWGIADRLAREP